MKIDKNALVISFYTNLPGSCQAEWVDDRMNALIDKGFKITLISSRGVFKHKNDSIRHIRIPCINPHGAKSEFNEIESRNIKINLYLKFYYRVMAFIDFILKKIGLETGEGRWNWTLSSLFSLFYGHGKYTFIYSTGGPASVHLLGIVYAKLLKSKLFIELQDPLTGEDIGRNKFSKLGLSLFEKFFVKNAYRVIYCTKNACKYSKESYPKYEKKIHHIYPGSYLEQGVESINFSEKKIRFTYLGSLYSTRNVTNLMEAIDKLHEDNPIYLNKFKIDLFGNIEEKILNEIKSFKHDIFVVNGLVSRELALNESLKSDVLLLIQNTDNRSMNTIPFKTYDYLRTGKLIFALTYKNKEINNLLTDHNHIVADASHSENIYHGLKKIIDNISELNFKITKSKLTPMKAVEEMLELL